MLEEEQQLSSIQLNDNLISIAIGVRFRANFSIEDQLGKIVDQILYSKDSYFSPKIFPEALTVTGKKILSNPKTGDRLTIDNSNVILEVVLGESFLLADRQEIIDQYERVMINRIMLEFDIKEIMRIGYIESYVFNVNDLADQFTKQTIGDTLDGVNEISLRFSKKLHTPSGLVKKDINDYDGAIFSVIKKADSDELFMSVDYQRHFDPFLPTAKGIKYSSFIKRAEEFNHKKSLPWLKSNYLEGGNE